MRLHIEKVPAEQLSVERFFENYYLPERPVLICGVPVPAVDRSFLSLTDSPNATLRNGNLSLPLSATPFEQEAAVDVEQNLAPELVRAVLSRSDVVIRPLPVRAWIHPRGYRTPLHFDGNSLHGLNLLIQGRKRWTLISPDTPTRLMPLTYFAMTHRNFEPDPDRHDFYQFETEPGDMLFLPRYWLHAVDSLGEQNANLNWVWTPHTPNVSTFIGRRECAMLRLKSLIRPLARLPRYHIPVYNYGDGGKALFRAYSRAVGPADLALTAIREACRYLELPFFSRSVNRQIDEMEGNTFVTPGAEERQR